MERDRTSYVIVNIIASLFNTVVGAVLPFFVRTFTIKYLGSEYMGLNSLCASLLSLLNAANLGVNSAFAYKLYKPMAQKDTDKICALLNLFRKVYFAIGIIIFAAGMCIMPFLRWFISGNVPQGINIYAVFFMYLMGTVLTYTTFAYKNLIFLADQRNDICSIIATLSFIVMYGVQIILIAHRYYYLSVLMLPVVTLLENLLRDFWARKKYPEYIARGDVTSDTKSEIKRDVFSVAIYKLRGISRNSLDSVVISTFAGLAALSNYQNYYTVFTIPVMLLGTFYSACLPSMGNYAAMNEVEETYGVYHKNIFIQSFLGGWFAICYGFLIQDCMALWLGAEYWLSDVLVFLLACYLYVLSESNLLSMMRESVGLWNFGRKSAALEMVSNLVLNVVFMKLFGVEGIVLATIVSMLFISIPVENVIIYRHYFVGKFRERIRMLVCNLIWLAVTAVIVWLLCGLAQTLSIEWFVYKMCVCAFVPILTLAVFFHKTEDFKFMVDVVRMMFRRKKD